MTPNIVLRRQHFEQLLREPVEVRDELNGKLVCTISLHADAELIARLILNADLVDPRGTTDLRLRIVEPAIRAVLEDQSEENLAWLRLAHERTFTP